MITISLCLYLLVSINSVNMLSFKSNDGFAYSKNIDWDLVNTASRAETLRLANLNWYVRMMEYIQEGTSGLRQYFNRPYTKVEVDLNSKRQTVRQLLNKIRKG